MNTSRDDNKTNPSTSAARDTADSNSSNRSGPDAQAPLDARDEGQNDGQNDGHNDTKDDSQAPKEIGGRKGPDPVRYGDWEKQGRCIDF